jgi:protein-S-isoprenylcysteine O-methyltransferase Ste14
LKLGALLFKIRGFTPIPFFAAAIIWAQPRKDLVIFGAVLIAFGELMRIWGVSYAGCATRTRNVGAPQLVTNGPYAHLRNPLYLGNIFMYVGAIIATGAWLPYLMWLVIFFFSFQYMFIVRLEEKKLIELFGEEYEKYANAVPRYFPRLSPYPNRTVVKANLKNAIRSEKTTFLSILTFLIVFFIRWSLMGS